MHPNYELLGKAMVCMDLAMMLGMAFAMGPAMDLAMEPAIKLYLPHIFP